MLLRLPRLCRFQGVHHGKIHALEFFHDGCPTHLHRTRASWQLHQFSQGALPARAAAEEMNLVINAQITM